MSDAGILIPILGISCGLVAIIGGAFVRPWMRFKERQLELQSHEAAEKAARYAAQTERLEQRVRVLERILTDQGNQLAAQIEDLRGEPAHREG